MLKAENMWESVQKLRKYEKVWKSILKHEKVRDSL